MMAFVLAAAFAGGGSLVLADRGEIVLSRPAVTLADVAGRGGLGRLGVVEIARLPVGRDRLSLSRRAIATLVRRAVPGMVVEGGDARIVTFRYVRRAEVGAGGCQVTSAAIAAGTAITRDKIAAGPCTAAAAIRYGAARGYLVARRDLPAGSPLGHLVVPPPATVAKGDSMTLVSRAGPVTVERPVIALQSGSVGRRVFVRDSRGHVFAAPVATVTP
ncbi:flagella basal body P-ring formation protein FlgA [Sphingomonas asaccharolytica]|uniref:flagella basal body P-ring formation protein FlgA n=1 Tax=Sphingomonas asaccharolytica TaxID=40681 RepID=UPI00082D2A0D|nr:flagella basal body P-ring formation protein FlgA [Sphingomonas asaccharolytica]